MIKIIYHVYTDHQDEYTENRQEAQNIFDRMKKTGCARLYIEEYATAQEYEDGDPHNEECIESFGRFPW